LDTDSVDHIPGTEQKLLAPGFGRVINPRSKFIEVAVYGHSTTPADVHAELFNGVYPAILGALAMKSRSFCSNILPGLLT